MCTVCYAADKIMSNPDRVNNLGNEQSKQEDKTKMLN